MRYLCIALHLDGFAMRFFLFGTISKKVYAPATVSCPQCCVLKALEYTKYACGFQPCLADRILAADTKTIFIDRP